MALAGPPAEQSLGPKVAYSRKSATSIDMSRSGTVTLDARVVVEQSSVVNGTHLLTPKSLVYSIHLVKKILGSGGIANNRSGSSWGRGKCLGPFLGREAKRVGNRCTRGRKNTDSQQIQTDLLHLKCDKTVNVSFLSHLKCGNFLLRGELSQLKCNGSLTAFEMQCSLQLNCNEYRIWA